MFNMKVLLSTVIWYEYDGGVCKKGWGDFKKRAMADICHSRRGKFSELT